MKVNHMTKKILFFTAGPVPTVAEQAQIDALNAKTKAGFEVGVRNALESGSYGAGIEACDLVAGTIPTAFNGKTNYGTADALRPALLSILPNPVAITGTGTKQLQVLKVMGDDVSALTVTDVTATSTTYSSSATNRATVNSAGLVTGVSAGTSVITATHTYTTGKTLTATVTVTVS